MARWIFLAALVSLALFSALRIDFGTDITHFIPDDERADLAGVSRALATSSLSRTMTITIGASDGTGNETARSEQAAAIDAAARAMVTALRRNAEVAWVRDGSDEELGEDIWELYFPRRFYFAGLDPRSAVSDLVSESRLRESAGQAKSDLLSPVGMLTKRTVARDPLGLFQRIIDRMGADGGSRPGGGLVRRNGRLWSQDGHAVIFLGTHSSAFASAPQAKLLDDIDAEFADIAARTPVPLVLERGGANRFAVDAERSIRGDVYRISALSVLGVIAIFAAFFPSPWRLLLVLLPALTGIVCATATCIGLFGRIDGLTLAFGSSLIGVAIDYPIHLLNHQSLAAIGAGESARRLRATLSLGAGTTIASFAGLAITSFPGFREIGVFAMTGMAAALLTTLFVVPLFAAATAESPPRARRTAQGLDRMLALARAARGAFVLLPVAVVALAFVFLPRLGWEDDLAKLNRIDPRLQAEDDRVRARVSAFDGGRFVVAVGQDTESALRSSERVQSVLSELISSGVVGGTRSVTDYLWSRELQRENVTALLAVPGLADRVSRAYQGAGFRVDSTQGFARDLAAFEKREEVPPPLTEEDLSETAIGALLAGLLVKMDARIGRVAAITQLRSVADADALKAALDEVPDAYLLDQRNLANAVYADFRWQTLRQIAVGSALVLIVLLLRYRRWRPALAAFLPSALVALLVPTIASALGTPLNLLHAVSLVMVMGMGVDYGIFLVDGAREGGALGATTLSLLLSCLTTVMVFGVLALSSNPALAAIGWTTGVGVLLSFLLAPISLVILEEGS